MNSYLLPLIGGVIIGIAVSLMLYFSGRVVGISGIINSATVDRTKNDIGWRWLFIAGLFFGGLILRAFEPNFFQENSEQSAWLTVIAGLLVGFGTLLGSGCTSGHGVCGISRLSPRSLVATITFILFGIISVYFFRHWGILP